MSGKPQTARSVALSVLISVLHKHQEVDAAFDTHANPANLSVRDRQFAYLLTLTTLRHFGRLQALAQAWMERPLPERSKEIMLILALGLAQIYLLNTPAHAAVHEMVELCKPRHTPLAGLVNALLQRATREPAALAAIPITRNLPAWLVENWQRHYPNTEAMLHAILEEPPLDITPKAGVTLEGATTLANGTLRLKSGNVPAMQGFDEGAWWVQDVSAALPVTLFGELKGKRVLDMCAAPGGKTAQLIAAGADVTALDISANRMARVKENLARLQLACECVVANALDYQAGQTFDAILLDAPCSATGTIRRHPDVAWLKTQADVARLVGVQRKLISHAISLLKAGGTLVYSVCSLEPEEGEAQAEWLLETHPELQATKATPPIVPAVSRPHGYRFLPTDLSEHGGMDGFYMVGFAKD